ncbi:small ribosomal subunit protein mS31-like [Ornithodoros turicata]
MAAPICIPMTIVHRFFSGSLKSSLRPTSVARRNLYKYFSSVSSSSSSSSDSSDSSDSDRDEPASSKREAALDKLKLLITDMKIESVPSSDSSSLSFKLARPGLPRKPVLKKAAEKARGLDEQLVQAAKEVASSLGGDTEKTESELLSELRLHAQEKREGGDLNEDKRPSMSELFVGMKIDRKSRRRDARSQRVDAAEDGDFLRGSLPPGTIDALTQAVSRERKRRTPASGTPEQIDLKGAARLDIFSADTQADGDAPCLSTWDKLQARELHLLVAPPPKNAYEEMILWTKQGKLWTFPINNEAGLDEEAKVGFHEHVFLESLIEDFPKKGPVRHFMELVTTGLSKNPYISVQRKREHIDWFRNYFREKEAILKAAGALPQ